MLRCRTDSAKEVERGGPVSTSAIVGRCCSPKLNVQLAGKSFVTKLNAL